MSDEGFEGFIPALQKQGVEINWPPVGRINIEELFAAAIKLDKQNRNRIQEYVLTDQEAEILPLELLNYLGNKFRVLCSLKASNIIEQRENQIPKTNDKTRTRRID